MAREVAVTAAVAEDVVVLPPAETVFGHQRSHICVMLSEERKLKKLQRAAKSKYGNSTLLIYVGKWEGDVYASRRAREVELCLRISA